MIDWKIDLSEGSENAATMRTEGNLATICAEIALGISRLYNRLLKDDTEVANRFRKDVLLGLILPDSPVWRKGELQGEIVIDASALRRIAEQKRTPDHEEDS